MHMVGIFPVAWHADWGGGAGAAVDFPVVGHQVRRERFFHSGWAAGRSQLPLSWPFTGCGWSAASFSPTYASFLRLKRFPIKEALIVNLLTLS